MPKETVEGDHCCMGPWATVKLAAMSRQASGDTQILPDLQSGLWGKPGVKVTGSKQSEAYA